MTTAETLPVMPFDRQSILEIPPLARVLQREQPIARVRTPAGDEGWLVTGYDLARELLTDETLGRAHPDPERAPRFAHTEVNGGPLGNFDSEQADHARMRRIMTRSFMVKRMNGMRPHVQELVDQLLSRLARGGPPADLHESLAAPLPILVICELLGVPYEDRDQFRAWSEDLGNIEDRERAVAGYQKLYGYMYELLQRKKAHLTEDVLSDFIRARAEDGLTEDEMVQLAAGLLWAGHETTVTRIDLGALLLLAHPDQRAALQSDPGLVVSAVEEILRMSASSVSAVARYASRDTEIGGVTIRTGDLVLLAVEVANRDPNMFAEPDRFDITRTPADGQHVAFGHGARFCIGAGLARVELQTVFGALFQRFPTMRLAVPVEELRIRKEAMTGGLYELPVTW